MSIGTGIVLFVIGAILTFAVHVTSSVVSIQLIGEILMGAGVVVFIIGLVLLFRKRESITTVQNGVDANGQNVSQRRTSTTPEDRV